MIKPYFDPTINYTGNFFTAYLNSFIGVRTHQNEVLMRHYLEQMSGADRNNEIKALQERRSELLKGKIDMTALARDKAELQMKYNTSANKSNNSRSRTGSGKEFDEKKAGQNFDEVFSNATIIAVAKTLDIEYKKGFSDNVGNGEQLASKIAKRYKDKLPEEHLERDKIIQEAFKTVLTGMSPRKKLGNLTVKNATDAFNEIYGFYPIYDIEGKLVEAGGEKSLASWKSQVIGDLEHDASLQSGGSTTRTKVQPVNVESQMSAYTKQAMADNDQIDNAVRALDADIATIKANRDSVSSNPYDLYAKHGVRNIIWDSPLQQQEATPRRREPVEVGKTLQATLAEYMPEKKVKEEEAYSEAEEMAGWDFNVPGEEEDFKEAVVKAVETVETVEAVATPPEADISQEGKIKQEEDDSKKREAELNKTIDTGPLIDVNKEDVFKLDSSPITKEKQLEMGSAVQMAVEADAIKKEYDKNEDDVAPFTFSNENDDNIRDSINRALSDTSSNVEGGSPQIETTIEGKDVIYVKGDKGISTIVLKDDDGAYTHLAKETEAFKEMKKKLEESESNIDSQNLVESK